MELEMEQIVLYMYMYVTVVIIVENNGHVHPHWRQKSYYREREDTKIYACFVDFQKVFDSVWHNGLFLKLLESGIGGKTYDLIKSMYT